MSQSEFLARLMRKLDSARIPAMLTGSVCSSYYGEMRATNDIDFVIAPNQEQLGMFLDAIGDDDYYVSRAAAQQALSMRGMFNVIDYDTGWKADLVIRKHDDYSAEAFARRRPAEVLGVNAMMSSPEDIVLAKLLWANQSASDRQLRDAAGVLEVQRESIDWDYLQKWARTLNVTDSLAAIRPLGD